MNKPILADVMPGHPTARYPHSRMPIRAIGFRRNGAPIWPVAGGSQPIGVPGTVQPTTPLLGGQQHPAGGQQFLTGLGGVPVPMIAPPGYPGVQPQAQQPAGQVYPGQPAGPQSQYMAPQGQPYGPPQGVMPGLPYQAGPPVVPQQQVGFPFAFPAPGQPGQQVQQQGQPGNGQQPAGQQQPGPQQPGQQQSSGGGQQQTGGGSDGPWDKPYPQKPLAEMNESEQNAYWKYHNRKLEDRIRSMGDYEQVKQQLAQLTQMTQTEWQRAVLEAETRGRNSAMEQAAGQMVAVAFQGAANQRMTPDQITAQLARLDAKSFVHNGQVDIAAIHAYVDTIAPARQNGLVPLLPQQQHQNALPLQHVQLGGQQLQPGQPGYGQQPLTGPLGQPQQHALPGYPQQPGWSQPGYPQQGYGPQPVYQGQVMPGPGQVPIPGVPSAYQPAAYPTQPVVQSAGLAGLPHLGQQPPALPGVTDFGQGPAVPGAPANPAQAGSAMAAARHGRTRSQQLAATRGA